MLDKCIQLLGLDKGTKLYELGLQIPLDCRFEWYGRVISAIEQKSSEPFKAMTVYKYLPVGIKEFIESPYYLDKAGTVYPIILNELVEMNSGKYVELVLSGGIGCVDSETEFLSPTGWIRMDSWLGQKVLQVSELGVGTFVTPKEYIVKPCSEFYHIHTKYGVDQMLSEEHRVWYKTSKNNWRFTTVPELYKQHTNSIKGWGGLFATTAKVNVESSVILTDAQLRVQVMLQADGSFPKGNKEETKSVVILIKKERKIIRLRELLNAANITFSDNDAGNGFRRFRFTAPLKTKRYSDWAWGCSTAQLSIIAEECLLWDGSKNSFYSTVESDADFIQYAMLLSGKRAVKELDSREGKPLCWIVRGNSNLEIGIQGVPIKTPIGIVPSKDGKKYCFTVPEGRFLIRRNGKTVVTGNSGKALDIKTPIPVSLETSTTGWKSMGGLVIGDKLYDDLGDICTVVGAFDYQHNRDCYEVVFEDSDTIIADAEHLWGVYDRPNGTYRIITTKEMKDSLRYIYVKSPTSIRGVALREWRKVIFIQEVVSRPVRCIQVDSKSNLFLAGKSYIPTHNTTAALYTTAYQLYLLSCMKDPHGSFGLDKASEILFIFQSLNATLAKALDFTRFKTMIEVSPYFIEHFPFNPELQSKLVFPNRIEVVPVSGLETAAIGQNVIGGCFPPTQKFIKADGTIATLGGCIGTDLQCYTIDENNIIGISDKTRVVHTGMKTLIKLTFDNGGEITCTPDQRFKDIHHNWIRAEDGYGHYFKTIDLQTLRESGYLFDESFESCASNDRKGIQSSISNGKTYGSTFSKYNSQKYYRYGKGYLSSVPTTFTNDYIEAFTLSWYDSSTVSGEVSRCGNENRKCEGNLGGEVAGSCIGTTQRPGIQEVLTNWDCQGTTFSSCSNTRENERPCGEGKGSSETTGLVGELNPRTTRKSFKKCYTTKDILSGKRWNNLQLLFKSRSCYGLLYGYIGYSLDLRDWENTLYMREKSATNFHTGFSNGFKLCGGEVFMGSFFKSEKMGFKTISSDGQTFNCFRSESFENSESTKYICVYRYQSSKESCNSVQRAITKVGSLKCTRITVFSEELTPVYDVEYTGYTHTFLAILEGGTTSVVLIPHQCIDELNYMAVTEKSKSSIDGGTYDQAVSLYNSIARRRKSRFQTSGSLPGILCLVSSKRYPGQFTDIKEAEAVTDKTIYVYDKRVWDVKPQGSFSGVFFDVFIGDEGRKPRILLEGDLVDPKDRHLVDHIPIEFKTDFEGDIINSLREIAGKSTLARHPFIVNTDAISKCMDRDNSIFSLDVVDFVSDELYLMPDNFYKPELPRYAHIDLGITGDSAGFCIGTVTEFEKIKRNEEDIGELLPKYHIDGCLEVRPPKGGEILFYKIRNILYKLRDMGLNIRWVSYDTFQCLSGDTQIWTDHGMVDAKDVTEGMMVQSRIGARPIIKKWSFGLQPTIKMLTSDHSGLEITEKHKIEVAIGWTYGSEKPRKRAIWGWVEAKNLKVGDVIRYWNRSSDVDVPNLVDLLSLPPKNKMCHNYNNYDVPTKLTVAFAELLGVIWGDGHIHRDGIYITCAKGEELCAAQVIKNVFSMEPSIRKVNNHYVVGICSQILVRWLAVNDLIKNFDIPKKIKQSPKIVQAAFIRGLFSTDGSVNAKGGESSFSTVNEKWAQYVHVFLRSAFGIQSCVVKSERTGDNFNTSNPYQFIVVVRGSRKKFYDTIGFCYKEKSEKLEKHLAKPGRDLLLRITSLEKSSTEVFDFEVAEDHSYVANGYVSHNSRDSMQILKQKGFFTGTLSMDVSTLPYEITKTALYDGRITMPVHAKLRRELSSLEMDTKKGRVDHPSSAGGCHSGDIEVFCFDGIFTFEKLVKDYSIGISHFGYAFNSNTNSFVKVLLESPRITKNVTTLIELEFAKGVVRCTPDHLYMLSNGLFKEAQFLTIDDDLKDFYFD